MFVDGAVGLRYTVRYTFSICRLGARDNEVETAGCKRTAVQFPDKTEKENPLQEC